VDTVQLLLENEGDVNNGKTPRSYLVDYHGSLYGIKTSVLAIASLRGHEKVVRILLAAGADVNLRDGFGITALIGAAYVGHVETVKALLTAGADVMVRDTNGCTALVAACYQENVETVGTLLAAGAEFLTPQDQRWRIGVDKCFPARDGGGKVSLTA